MAVTIQNLCIKAAPFYAALAMGASLFCLLWRYFVKDPPALPEGDPPQGRRILLWACVWFVLSRLLIVGTLLIAARVRGEMEGLMSRPWDYWIRWDAPHYLGLAENGYVTEGDPRFHIVFYPLYPALTACLRPLFGGDTALAACVLSNLCFLGAGVALTWAVWLRQGRECALRALPLMMLCPYSVFCSTAYTESLFLLLCALAVLFARRERFGWAIFFGALAANTRMPGVLIAVPIFYEMLRKARREKLGAGYVAGCALSACLVLLGVGAYVALNYFVTGDPFRFMTYQREHWGQQLGLFYDTFRYTVENAFSYHSEMWRLYTWIPQAAAMLLSFALMLGAAFRRADPGDGAFMWVYLCVALGTTWLLSGPRYLCGMYALYPILASVFRKRYLHIPLCVLFAALLSFFSIVYALEGWLL